MGELETLDDILGNDEPQPRDEQGRFAAKGEEAPQGDVGESPSPVVEPVEPAEPAAQPELEHPAILGERRRRQAAEARIAELEAAQNAKPAQPIPSVFDDEEAAWEARSEQLLTLAEQRALARMEERNIARSAEKARAKYQDWETAVATFQDLATQNPLLERQLRDSDNPGEFAYTTAKAHMELQQYGGDINALVQARVQAELAKAKPATPAPALPETLASGSGGRGSASTPTPMLTLEQILSG